MLLWQKIFFSDTKCASLTPNMLLWRLVRKRCQLRRVWRPLAPPLQLVQQTAPQLALGARTVNTSVWTPCVNSELSCETLGGGHLEVFQVCEAPGGVNIFRWTTRGCPYLKVNSLSCEHLACDIGQKKIRGLLFVCQVQLEKELFSSFLQTDLGLKAVWGHFGNKTLQVRVWAGRPNFEGLRVDVSIWKEHFWGFSRIFGC